MLLEADQSARDLTTLLHLYRGEGDAVFVDELRAQATTSRVGGAWEFPVSVLRHRPPR